MFDSNLTQPNEGPSNVTSGKGIPALQGDHDTFAFHDAFLLIYLSIWMSIDVHCGGHDVGEKQIIRVIHQKGQYTKNITVTYIDRKLLLYIPSDH